jgi:hypothetical protein
MAKHVNCPLCGETISGADDDALVEAADKHGDDAHNGMHAPRAMILATAKEG